MTTRNSAAAMAGACLACLLAGCTSMGGTSGDDNLTDGLDKDQAVFFSSAGGENCASRVSGSPCRRNRRSRHWLITGQQGRACRSPCRSGCRRRRRLRLRPCRELPVRQGPRKCLEPRGPPQGRDCPGRRGEPGSCQYDLKAQDGACCQQGRDQAPQE